MVFVLGGVAANMMLIFLVALLDFFGAFASHFRARHIKIII